MLHFSSVLWVLNKIHILLLQETRAWDGEDIRWEGWACFLAPSRPPWLPQRMPSRRRWRTVRKFRRLLRLVWSTGRSLFLTSFVTEEQNLVKELVAMSTQERFHAIRELPMSFEEKKSIRWVGQTVERCYAFSLVLLTPRCWPSHTPLTIKVRFQGAFHINDMKTN